MTHKPDTHSEAITPSPMMVGGGEVGGLSYTPDRDLIPYVLRFTPIGDRDEQVYDMQAVIDELLIPHFDIWVISQELKPKLHFHVYLETFDNPKDLRKKLRDFIYPYYPVRARGFGTKQYSCILSENPLNAIIYLLKQRGEYHFNGFSQEFINSCLQSSFEKEASEFEKEVADLSLEFLNSQMDPYIYAERLCIIYSSYDKRVHFKDIQGIVNSKIIKRDPSSALSMVKRNMTF